MPNAGRAAGDFAAEIALHGNRAIDVGYLRSSDKRGDPRKKRLLRLLVNHEDVVVRTVSLAVPAADAVALNVDLAAGISGDGVGRTVEHAERVLALPAGVRRQKIVEVNPGE